MLEELAWGQVIFSWETGLGHSNDQRSAGNDSVGFVGACGSGLSERLDGFTFVAPGAGGAASRTWCWLLVSPEMASPSVFWRKSLGRLFWNEMPARYSSVVFRIVGGTFLAYCVATRSFSELLHNRDQGMAAELVLYGSALLLTRVLHWERLHQPSPI